jgi:hypothetical protein
MFYPHELRFLRLNTPGPSGKMGGYQQFENWILRNTDTASGSCLFDPVRLERLMRYCKPRNGYGPGGPNGRLRNACIPALRRIGIDPAPDWRAP